MSQGQQIFLTNLFADDTTFQLSSNSLEDLELTVNKELTKAEHWFNMNKLTLHPSKTKFMVFGNTKNKSLSLTLGGVQLEQMGEKRETKTYKFLGVFVDEHLSWKHHIKHIFNKTQKLTFALLNARSDLSTKTREMIYRSLIKPHFEYAIPIWGNSKHAECLNKQNKKIIRVVAGKQKLAHAEPLLKEFNHLHIKDIFKLNCLSTAMKAKNKEGPKILQEFLSWYPPESRRAHLLRIPKFNNLTQKTTSVSIPELWNEQIEALSEDMLKMPSRLFKSNLKKIILDSYYETCDLSNCYSCSRHKSD